MSSLILVGISLFDFIVEVLLLVAYFIAAFNVSGYVTVHIWIIYWPSFLWLYSGIVFFF